MSDLLPDSLAEPAPTAVAVPADDAGTDDAAAIAPADPAAPAAAPAAPVDDAPVDATSTSTTSTSTGAPGDLWDPTQYLLFDEARSRPGHDLLQRVVTTLDHWRIESPRRVFDLGCGPGKQAAMLARSFTQAQVIGVDSSANMIQTAQAAMNKLDDADLSARVQFKQATFEEFQDAEGADVIYSSAALHWAHNHASLFPYLVQQLRSDGGVLAVQMPNNFREPSHTCMRRALEEGAFFTPAELDAVWARQPDVHEEGASYYWHLLAPHCRHVDAWQTEYQQLISSPTRYHPVLEWTKSTALAPLLAALPTDSERTRFMELYSMWLEDSYPIFIKDGKPHTLFPFKRIFLIAVK